MLFYQSYLPSRRLSSLVARYMIISDDRKHQEWQQMEVAPTGLPGLGFSYGENFRYHISPGEQHEISCRSEEHTSELQSLMRISYAVFCLKKKTQRNRTQCAHPDTYYCTNM